MNISVCVDALYRGKDVYKSIEELAQLGFKTIEFWSWWDKDIERLVELKEKYNLTYSAFCTKLISLTDYKMHEEYIKGLKESIAVANRLGCRQLITQVGADTGASRESQHRAIVEGLKRCVPELEQNGITLLVEPLNAKIDHKGYYLTHSAEAFEIIEEVGSNEVKVLFDIYHQQITEGDILRHIQGNLDHIGHFHAAGNPGRVELEYGELNYKRLFQVIYEDGFKGYIGLEYFPKGEVQKGLRKVKELESISDKSFKRLYEAAKGVVYPRQLSESAESGGVGAALLTVDGNIYTGVCIDTACSMGFCAEHAAAAAMITQGEHHIIKVIAVDWDGKVLPPCGRCREFLSQLHPLNSEAEVKVTEDQIVTLRELLPYDWKIK